MKKALSLLLALAVCLLLCACGGETDNAGTANNSNTEAATNAPQKQETTAEPEGPAAEPIQLEETISLDYAVLTLDAFEISDGYEFSYTEKSSGITITHKSSIDCPSGMKLLCLKGKFTNKAKAEVYPGNDPAGGKIIINGYEYETRMQCYNVAEAESVMGVAPLREVDYFLYAEIPETLAAEMESCEFYIGFAKDLDPTVWIDDLSDYDALYLLKATPAAE